MRSKKSGGVITGFTLTFYADAGNQPGAVLATSPGAGNFGETFVVGSKQSYAYSWTLAIPFAASAGKEHWASIVPDLGLLSEWRWETSSGADNFAGNATSVLVERSRPTLPLRYTPQRLSRVRWS